MDQRTWSRWPLIISILSTILLFAFPSYGFVTLESAILGKNFDDVIDEKSDPLNYVFRSVKEEYSDEKLRGRDALMQYLGFFRYGEEIDLTCGKAVELVYHNVQDRLTAVRSIVNTLQYVGLDITSRAIIEYSKFFKFSDEEFSNLVTRLVGNYCSSNTTVISLKHLFKNFVKKFQFQNSPTITLPDFSLSPLFPQKLNEINSQGESLKQEFLYTVKLFKAFCSWGGDLDDFRLLVPILKNPFIMSFIFRQLDQKKIFWDSKSGEFSLIQDPNTVQVVCDELICRKANPIEFNRKYPRMIGSISVYDDGKRVYCEEFSRLQYDFEDISDQRMKKWMLRRTPEEDNLINLQFISLITGVPDLLVRANKYSDIVDFIRYPVDKEWDAWVERVNKNYSKTIYYEDSMVIEKVNKIPNFPSKSVPNFQVVFDIYHGEFDKAQIDEDKVGVKIEVPLSVHYLRWLRDKWIDRDPHNTEYKEKLISVLKHQVDPHIDRAYKKFIIPPWKGDLARIVAIEILKQLEAYSGTYFIGFKTEWLKIPIRFRFGIFALKYIHERFLVRHKVSELDA